MIPSALMTDSFTIKKTDQSITSGKITHTVSTVSTGSKGRFDPNGGSRNRDFMGSIKQASMVLYTNYDAEIKFGRIIINEADSAQYDVIRVDSMAVPGSNHHMEVYLEQRRIAIG